MSHELGLSEVDRCDFEQDGYVEVLVKLTRFDPSRGSVLTFVERLVRNKMRSIRRLRRRDRWQLDDDVLSNPDSAAMVRGYSDQDCRLDVSRLLANLPPSDQGFCLLLMKDPLAEASRLAGIARSTAYTTVARLRDAFQQAGLGLHGPRKRRSRPSTLDGRL